jgi:hypothetical protein
MTDPNDGKDGLKKCSEKNRLTLNTFGEFNPFKPCSANALFPDVLKSLP